MWANFISAPVVFIVDLKLGSDWVHANAFARQAGRLRSRDDFTKFPLYPPKP